MFSLRTDSQTLRPSSTSCSSSSQPPCFQSAWLHFSPTTAGSSVRTDLLWVGVSFLHQYVCVLFVDAEIIQRVSYSSSLVFVHGEFLLSVCLQFAQCRLCTNDEACFIAFFPPSVTVLISTVILKSLSGPLSDGAISHYVCTVAHFVCQLRRVDYPEEYVTV